MISSDFKYLNELIKLSDKKDIIGDSPFTKFYVYLVEDKVVSFLVFDDIYDRIEVVYVYTDNNYRKCGYAYKLFDKLISYYKNYNNITLEVRKNNISAINLYKKLGFNQVGVRENYYDGIDGILMKLDLY